MGPGGNEESGHYIKKRLKEGSTSPKINCVHDLNTEQSKTSKIYIENEISELLIFSIALILW